jgi:CheY-like chemotaxis protein
MLQCARATADILNLASRKQQVVVETHELSLIVTQDRRAVEQLLTRVLDCALKLAKEPNTKLSLRIAGQDKWFRLAITAREAELAHRVCDWLNADPENAVIHNPSDVPFGLALLVAGRWLHAMGGAAGLESQSVVTLDLPSCTREGASRKGEADGLKVLVAEDNDESFALTETMLRQERVWRAHDGQQALEMVRNQRFDIIFMDIHMPGMSGYDVIRRMRDWETRTGSARTPMVVLSADDLETQQRFAAEFGCSGFLKKPVGPSDVLPLLHQLK